MITHLFLLGPDASRLVALLTFSDRRDRAFTLTCFRAAGRRPDQDRSCPIIAIGQLPEVTVHIGTLVLIVWLIIGAIAAGQRHEYTSPPRNCNQAATVAVTILAGPLNYLGVDPKISCSRLPQPSR